MISVFQPVAERTQSRKARLLRESRSAAVATTRTRSVANALHRAMKSLQHLNGERHCLRIERAIGKDALAQTRDLAVLVKSLQASAHNFRNFEADRVGTDVNRGKCGHKSRRQPYHLFLQAQPLAR